MIEINYIFNCVNTKQHKHNVWVQMDVTQFEPDRRAVLSCPQCDNQVAIDIELKKRDLTHELLDLITLMPDSQTQEIMDYITSLRETRSRK